MKLRQFILEIGFPEFKAVVGKKGGRMLFLFFILFLSLLVIGVSNSADVLLEKKMDEPFISFIDVAIPILHKSQKDEFTTKEALNLVKDYNFLSKDFSRVHLDYKDFVINKFDQKTGTVIQVEKQILGMLLTEEDKFYKYMKEERPEIWESDTNVFQNKGFGIILTIDFFKEFGINGDDWKKMSFVEIILKDNTKVNIPISAVVSKLRNNCKFAMSKNLLQTEDDKIELLKSEYYAEQSTFFLLEGSEIPSSFYKVSDPNLSNNCYKKGFLVCSMNPSEADLLMIENFKGSQEVYDISIELSNVEDDFDTDFYTFFLDTLERADLLASIINTKFGIQIEQSKIESKNNFMFFQKITILLTSSLSLFAILSIIFFIVNILMSHLNTNKRSLGTLKAFGLSNIYILGLYSGITVFLVSVSFSIAYLFSVILGPFAIDIFVYLAKLDGDFSDMFVFKNVGFLRYFVLLVIIPTVFILTQVFQFLYKVTPGDLIYERK